MTSAAGHYLDEYALFYSRMLNPPRNTVTRLHFFEKAFDRAALSRWMTDVMRGRDTSETIAKQAGRGFDGEIVAESK